MRIFILLLISFSPFIAKAQNDTITPAIVDENTEVSESIETENIKTQSTYKEGIVKHHKRKIKLTLIIDSLVLSDKSFSLAKTWTSRIRFETDYINIYDNVFVKIFISRNSEYKKKFYSWKWDYYKKDGSDYKILGSSFYSPIRYKYEYYSKIRGMGQGIGTQGTSDYLMIFYRYRID